MGADELTWSCPLPLRDYPEIVLAHGGGGRLMADLIHELFLPQLDNPYLRPLADSAILPLGQGGGRLAFSTDAYVVQPLFFPGGDIGSLAVNGTVNDLAVCGAWPLALSVALILEEGFALADLDRVARSLAAAARQVGVPVVTGDTKVVERCRGDGCYAISSGIGWLPPGVELGPQQMTVGDAVLVSGPIGRHGIAVLSAREGLGFETEVQSDCAPLHELARLMLEVGTSDGGLALHAMRDPTRGGVAAVLSELAQAAGLGIEIDEPLVPVPAGVRAACEMLGLDPLHVANEGILVAFVAAEALAAMLERLRAHPLGRETAVVGRLVADHPGRVVIRTPIGSTRILDRPLGEQLPRIC